MDFFQFFFPFLLIIGITSLLLKQIEMIKTDLMAEIKDLKHEIERSRPPLSEVKKK